MLAFNEPLQIKDDDGFISMTPYETIEVWIFSVCAPQYVMLPQLQSTFHYIVNHYVKILHVHLGVANNMHPLSWGGHKRKRSRSFIKSKLSA